MRRSLAIGLLMGGFLLAAPVTAQACECQPLKTTLEEDVIHYYDAVFGGTAMEVRLVEEEGNPIKKQITRFQVLKPWKGPSFADPVEIHSCDNPGVCCFSFTQGETYVVLAKKNSEGNLYVRLCDPTMRTTPTMTEEADKIVEILNNPKKP